jgi:hypothetical protein
MTRHGGVFGGGLAQEFFDGNQTFIGDDGLPRVVANTVGECVQNTAGFGQGFFFALADEGDHHGAGFLRCIGQANCGAS